MGGAKLKEAIGWKLRGLRNCGRGGLGPCGPAVLSDDEDRLSRGLGGLMGLKGLHAPPPDMLNLVLESGRGKSSLRSKRGKDALTALNDSQACSLCCALRDQLGD